MKKGRHRRFEEARALKRSHEVDFEDLFETISGEDDDTYKPEHDAWADVAEEWQRETAKSKPGASDGNGIAATGESSSEDQLAD